MAAIQWLDPISGRFADRRNWSGGVVPGSLDSAVLGAVGAAPYTVTSSGGTVVGSLQISAEAVLSIRSGTFSTLFGTGPGGNAGEIEVGRGGTFAASGTIVGGAYGDPNTGMIFARAGGTVLLTNATIIGGAFDTADEGVVVFSGRENFLNGLSAPVHNEGSMDLADNAALTVYGDLINTGVITLQGGADTSAMFLASPTVALSGGGTVVLGGAGADQDLIGASLDKATLENVDNTISGSGTLGNLDMVLVNDSGGLIDADGPRLLTLQTGVNTIVNAGTIEASGARGVFIASKIENDSLLLASGGEVDVARKVSGAGSMEIDDGGALIVGKALSQNVAFVGDFGVLELGRSLAFSGEISGFSDAGSELILDDIRFRKNASATFSGTSAGGVLTVTDGTRTADITLAGDFLQSTFMVSASAAGGVVVVAQSGAPVTPAPHAFAAAMASLGPPAVGGAHLSHVWSDRAPLLTTPRVATA